MNQVLILFWKFYKMRQTWPRSMQCVRANPLHHPIDLTGDRWPAPTLSHTRVRLVSDIRCLANIHINTHCYFLTLIIFIKEWLWFQNLLIFLTHTPTQTYQTNQTCVKLTQFELVIVYMFYNHDWTWAVYEMRMVLKIERLWSMKGPSKIKSAVKFLALWVLN